MASFPSLAAPFVARRRLAPAAVAALALLLAVLFLIVMGALGAIFGLRPLFSGGSHPSQLARADIPAQYLQLYVAAGRRYGLDPWILAGIGSVETDHGRSPAPGVRSGVNAFGCCAGPMQFSVVGSPSTWDRYALDGNDDGRTSVYDPADAIPAAARYLRASGAPDDYHASLFAYNHAEWYVAQVLTARQPAACAGAENRWQGHWRLFRTVWLAWEARCREPPGALHAVQRMQVIDRQPSPKGNRNDVVAIRRSWSPSSGPVCSASRSRSACLSG